MKRVIMHYDMDCFYASVEMRDNKKYRNRPIVVGSGVVTTANYKAREFGIHSAMSIIEAKRLCRNLIIVPVNKDKYTKESRYIQQLVLKITDKVEFIALDEGFIDISNIINSKLNCDRFAKLFRKRIFKLTGLTCSVGIGPNKLIAKIGSDIRKPGGQYIFNNEHDFMEYIKEKKVRILPGVGKQFEKILNKNNLYIVSDIMRFSLNQLIKKYGRARGELLYGYSRGIDYKEIEYKKIIHSIGNETTFTITLTSEVEISREIEELFNWSYNRLIKNKMLAKTIAIKLRFVDRETISRSKTRGIPTDDKNRLKLMLDELMMELNISKEIRLLGVSFSNLENTAQRQLSLDIF